MGCQPRATPDFSLLKSEMELDRQILFGPVTAEVAWQAYRQGMQRIVDYVNTHRIIDWDNINRWLESIEGIRKAAMMMEQSPDDDRTHSIESESLDALLLRLRTSAISLDEARAKRGLTTQQASDALASVFGHAAPEPISDDSGARDTLVWYDAL